METVGPQEESRSGAEDAEAADKESEASRGEDLIPSQEGGIDDERAVTSQGDDERPAGEHVFASFGEPHASSLSPYAVLPEELQRFVEQTAQLKFPVGSKKEFLDQVGGWDMPLYLGEVIAQAGMVLMYLPASMFPLWSPENFAEKLTDVYFQRRKVPELKPIDEKTMEALAKQFLAENEQLLVAVFRAVSGAAGLADIKPGEGVLAERFLEQNPDLIKYALIAARGSGTLLRSGRLDNRIGGSSRQPR